MAVFVVVLLVAVLLSGHLLGWPTVTAWLVSAGYAISGHHDTAQVWFFVGLTLLAIRWIARPERHHR